jgi:hypothetical protein
MRAASLAKGQHNLSSDATKKQRMKTTDDKRLRCSAWQTDYTRRRRTSPGTQGKRQWAQASGEVGGENGDVAAGREREKMGGTSGEPQVHIIAYMWI